MNHGSKSISDPVMPHKSICCIQTNALEDEFNIIENFPVASGSL